MKKQGAVLAAAIAATLGSTGAAEAALYTATLTSHVTFSNNATAGSALNISSSTATWQYDDVTDLVTQTGGLHNARAQTSPISTLFRHSITGMVIGNGAAASATSFVCTEGNFGGNVGASICGNYNFGANFANESSTTWGPGTAFARTMGGDDNALGPQQSILQYNGMTTVSFNGSTLVLSNATCTGSCTTTSGFNNGYQMTWSVTPVIPVPAAVWLFGSALGLMGVMRRRLKA